MWAEVCGTLYEPIPLRIIKENYDTYREKYDNGQLRGSNLGATHNLRNQVSWTLYVNRSIFDDLSDQKNMAMGTSGVWFKVLSTT